MVEEGQSLLPFGSSFGVIPQYIDWGLLPRALLGVLALVCGNGYIVGINQIYDVSVDTVNKPYLPIAAGAASCQGFAPGLSTGRPTATWLTNGGEDAVSCHFAGVPNGGYRVIAVKNRRTRSRQVLRQHMQL